MGPQAFFDALVVFVALGSSIILIILAVVAGLWLIYG